MPSISCEKCATINDSEDRFCRECGFSFRLNVREESSSSDTSRCSKCKVVISSAIKLKALGKEWHQECFVCSRCGCELKGGFFPHEGEPYCEADYDDLFLKKCSGCNRSIEGTYFDDRRGGIYHENCFKCSICNKSLDNAFFWHNDKVCCQTCGQVKVTIPSSSSSGNSNFGGARCLKCNKNFENGAKVLNIEGKQYHEHCFTCFVCGSIIGTSSYTVAPNEFDRFCCTKCAESGRADKCGKCGQVLLGTKITALGKKFHTGCFKCSSCGDNIPQNVDFFTSSTGLPVCKSCFN